MRNTSLELGYLGTRATQLPVQARINTISAFTAGLQPLPTFFSPGDVPAAIAGGSRLSDFENLSTFIHPEFSTMSAFPPIGGSAYHAGSADFNRHFERGLMFRANYTWAKNIDDATNELFSSVVNPRRPLDWMNLQLDRGRSTLDVRHKFAMSWIYEFPNLGSDSSLLKTLLHGWQWNGTYLVQSGQPISILANADANANGDAAGDRGILNLPGIEGVGTSVNLVCVGAAGVTSIVPNNTGCVGGTGSVAGYVAQNPNARYVQAELGSLPTLGRNSFVSPGVNVWNMGCLRTRN
jgi:hypothetical protein